MEITLKKALTLRSKLETFVSDLAINLTAELSIFVESDRVDPDAKMSTTRDEAHATIANKERASRILAELRPAIAKANVDFKVEELLASQAHVERMIALWKTVVAAEQQPVRDAITGELEMLRRQAVDDKPQGVYGSRGVNRVGRFSVVTDAMRTLARKEILELSREREAIMDKRTAVNVTARVEIAEVDVPFLTEQGFL